MDSLYLSYPGTLSEVTDARLRELKEVAQSKEAHQQAYAQLEVLGHIFEVRDKGAGLFPYVLEDNAYRVQLARSAAKSLPMAYVKLSSEFLTHYKPDIAETELRRVLDRLGEVKEAPNTSRIDLFLDFASSVDMESWDRRAWVTYAHSISAYAVDDRFSGWSVGVGGVISARLYDKTLEIEKSGKTYLLDLWKQAGWNGQGRVWRLEFELKRELLTQKGLSKLAQVLDNLNGLWSYCTTEWLRLALPSVEDQTRSRWPIHPLWSYLASVDFGADGGPLSSRFSATRAPEDDYLFSHGFSLVTSLMAREGIEGFPRGCDAFMEKLYAYQERKSYLEGVRFDQYVSEKVAIKARRFNSMLNATEQSSDMGETATDYRKQSDGE
ncbi:MAG: replication initiation factor [Pseudomonadota bacterium]